MDLRGRIALVTGVSGGIGYATALRLEEAGADLSILRGGGKWISPSSLLDNTPRGDHRCNTERDLFKLCLRYLFCVQMTQVASTPWSILRKCLERK